MWGGQGEMISVLGFGRLDRLVVSTATMLLFLFPHPVGYCFVVAVVGKIVGLFLT